MDSLMYSDEEIERFKQRAKMFSELSTVLPVMKGEQKMDKLEDDHEYHRAVKNNAEREKLLALYCNPHSFTTGLDTPIKHHWQTHTSAQFKYPTPENRVTKVYCIYCLEVKDI